MEITKNKNLSIEQRIYIIRGKEVMLSSDVANLYQVETKRINEVIKRNINRFPEPFCFKLTYDEINEISSRSQIATLNKAGNLRGSNIKYQPYALTEQGIMMLSGLLKSDIAVKVNIKIIDAFVKMRKYISNNLINSEILINHEHRLLRLENTFNKLEEKQKVNTIFFDGQIYDAYSLLIDILNKAKKEILIIDNYAGKELLDILKDINKKITIVSSNISETLKKKYTKKYNNITFITNNTFHDRFIILDNIKLYTCGASFKDLGKKCFAINEMNSQNLVDEITNKISN